MIATINQWIKRMSPQLLVTDMNRSIKFYTEKLNFNLDFQYSDFYSGISISGFSIHLKTGDPSTEARENKRINNDIDIAFSVDNIENMFNELNNRMIDFVQPLRNMEYGKEFYIADPDGYIIAFIEEPKTQEA